MEELATIEELERWLLDAGQTAFFIFKHSTRCPISAAAYDRMERYVAHAPPGRPPVYLVKVVESRPASNAVAGRLSVAHQSPQLILVSGAKAVWSSSHLAITGNAIEQAVKDHATP